MRRTVWRARPKQEMRTLAIRGCLLTAALAAAILPTIAFGATEPTVLKLSVSEDGVYRVHYEDLQVAGLGSNFLESATVGLTSAGKLIPLWLEDGGDGRFEPGDWLEFLGESPRGEVAYHHEYAGLNVYWLRDDVLQPSRMRAPEPGNFAIRGDSIARFQARQHLEQDRLLLRFSFRDQQDEDLWYWAKLSHIDKKPFQYDLRLEGLDVAATEPVTLRLSFRGWSKPRRKTDPTLKDHQVLVLIDQEPVGQAEWDGQEASLLTVELPAARLQPGRNALVLQVPARIAAEARDPLIDLVVLDWIEVSYPHDGSVGERQLRLDLPAETAGRSLRLQPLAADELVVYGGDGLRSEAAATDPEGDSSGRVVTVPGLSPVPQEGAGWIQVVPDGHWKSPESIELDVSSHLADASNQADYIMITHPRLREAIEPLAEFHRRRGLRVTVVDIRDVYDEFNHGILHPRAIRDFLHRAYHGWQNPAPRFVLLVGDASWDTKNPRVREKNYASWSYRTDFGFGLEPTRGTPYAENAKLNHRNLIPTWNYLTTQGHAASDNWYVAVDGDDFLPDMAIGRLPVTEPHEVEAIVEKTVRYADHPVVGPWRRRVLWISDGAERHDRHSDKVASTLATRGFSAVKVKPSANDPTNEHHRERLKDAFDQGELLVHFVGHGGRFIWRTAPADFKKNRDLFRLEDLDRLETHAKLPVIVSMTCYSAPFDHPNSDSIGEKFLRLPDSGAVGVIAASWRIIPGVQTSQSLMERLTESGSVGEALMHTKRELGDEPFNHLFNLLGDPALQISLPASGISLEMLAADPPRLKARFEHDPFAGRAIVDWMNSEGDVLESEIFDVEESLFDRTFRGDAAELAFVRVYVWSEEQGVDWLGSLHLPGREQDSAAGSS